MVADTVVGLLMNFPKSFTNADHNWKVFTVCFLSFIIFQAIEHVLRTCGPPRQVHLTSAERYINITVSLMHSYISGIWSVLCFYFYPHMAEDMFTTHNTFSVCLVSFSCGYFISDMMFMMRNRKQKQAVELVGHHIVVLLCFGSGLLSQQYITYAVVSLLVELNSIFLHSRQLMQIFGVPMSSMKYRLNSLVNIGTYIFFRIATLCWMCRWIVLNKDRIPLPFYALGSSGLGCIIIMNAVLFIRLLKNDFFRKDKKT